MYVCASHIFIYLLMHIYLGASKNIEIISMYGEYFSGGVLKVQKTKMRWLGLIILYLGSVKPS